MGAPLLFEETAILLMIETPPIAFHYGHTYEEKKLFSTHDVISPYGYALHTPKAPELLQDQRDSPCVL